MAVADLLEKIGEGAKTVGRVAGAVAEPLAKRTAEVISGEAPEIDQDKRARAEKLEDEQLAARASILENSLAMGQKYGTLTPDQQQQYVDEITKIYSNPRHAPTLMEKLRKAIHPDGTFAQAPQKTLENPTPEGGTVAQDEAVRERALADTLGLRQSATDEEIDRRAALALQKPPSGKSPPVPGNQLPAGAIGPDGNPISAAARNAGQSFVEYRGMWYTAPKAKPMLRMVGSDLLLIDPATGATLRKVASAQAKVTSRQTPYVGDDGQMHLATTYSVALPTGETIDAEAPPPEMPGGEKQPAPTATTPAKKVNPGAILPKTGAKSLTSAPGGMGPAIPGSRIWAASKNPEMRTAMTQAGKELPILQAAQAQIGDYLNNGVFDGPGDLSLQHAFFTATQPSTGFRMTKVQQDILQNSQSWLNSWEAKAHHVATGTWFSDDQRKQIAKAALDAIAEKEKALQSALGTQSSGSENVIVVSPEDMK